MSSPLVAHLNAAQRAAVEHVTGPLLILAGPGSGKTRVITHRIAYLLEQGIDPRQILALTFTNKAAEEMRQRLSRLAPDQPVWVGTFHRYGAQMLRRYASLIGLQENYSILDADDAQKLLQKTIEEVKLKDPSLTPQMIAQQVSRAKNNLIQPSDFTRSTGRSWDRVTQQVYEQYQTRLLRSNAVDFDDLLMLPACLLRDNPELRSALDARHRFIMVDEYQDTNLAQYALVRAMSIDHPNLAVTGDPDQSIYGWRGANLRNILDFEQDYPQVHVVRLEQNYRSSAAILRVADELIAHNQQRKAKELRTDNAEGEQVRLVTFTSAKDEASGIAARIAADIQSGRRRASDFAIFYRVNSLSRNIEHALATSRVPYQMVHGVEFYQRQEVKDLIAYLHLINNPHHDVAFLRVINTPTRGIGAKTVARLVEAATQHQLPLLEVARQCRSLGQLSARATSSILSFVALYDELRKLATASMESIMNAILQETGYRQQLQGSMHQEDLDRLANVDELATAAREFDLQHGTDAPLQAFLEQAALVNDTDDLQGGADKVTLMTLHAAKGLEFPVVFLIGVEQGLIPHERSREEPAQIEEERRLLFVGITRAQQELQLSYANYRGHHGLNRPTVPSPFLMELPRAEMQIVEPTMPLDEGYSDLRRPADASRAGKYPGADEDGFEAEIQVNDGWPGRPSDEEAEFAQERWQQDQLADAEFARSKQKERRTAASAIHSRLTTAAEMLRAASGHDGRVTPDQFELGMTVRHGSYGEGEIVNLSGTGLRRQAVVQFFNDGKQRTFRLQYAMLQPVKSKP